MKNIPALWGIVFTLVPFTVPTVFADPATVNQCEKGDAQVCYETALKLIKDDGLENIQEALNYLSKGCDNGYAPSCALGGSLALSAVKDVDMAFSLFKKGCAMNHGKSCFHLAQLYKDGRGTPANLIAAADSYNKACDSGEGEACVNLGIMYIGGAGVVQNFKQANIALTKACDLKIGSGCAALGQMYERGDGTDKDRVKALELYKKGCELGFKSVCNRK